MGKRLFTTIAVSLCLLSATAAIPAKGDGAQQGSSMPDGQEMIATGAVNSTEIDSVEVSKVAQEMMAAEKAEAADAQAAADPQSTESLRRQKQKEKAENARINDSWGGAITIVAMAIVLGALIVLSILFYLFGQISSSIMSKKKLKAHGKSKDEAEDHHLELDSGETIAAIALALAEHFDSKTHDLEDTILTIKKLRRSYSPWNSKIYNLRVQPELHRNVRR